jgi:hypothetical protein
VSWRPLYAVTLLLGGVVPCWAGEVWSWHSFDATILKTSTAEVALHARLRSGRSLGHLQQGRSGVIAKFGLRPNVTLIAGYYYGKEEDSAEEWRNFHRVFTGVEVPLYRGSRLRVDTRGVVEHFVPVDLPQFSRYRHRFRVRSERRIGPYVGGEWFFIAQGYLSSRYTFGVRWKCAELVAVEVGYLYDARRASIGEPRHVIVTQFTFDRLW